jgi:DNA-binding transcriptional MerR regulator
MQIGEVAERTGLSLRTIRYYEEVGLVVPSARSQGGFRLYTEPDIDRLQLIKRMKPLGFQLDEMRDLLAILDPVPGSPQLEDPAARLAEFSQTAEQACEELRTKLRVAEEFAALLRTHPAPLTTLGSAPPPQGRRGADARRPAG